MHCNVCDTHFTPADGEGAVAEYCCTECERRDVPFPKETILAEAERLTSGDRHDSYGSYGKEATKIATVFSRLTGIEITYCDVPVFMMVVKLVREMNKHKRDNLTDLCGYARLLSQLEKDEDE